MNKWVDIPGYTGRYQVNEYGQVKSLARKINTGHGYRYLKEIILEHSIKSEGYHFVRLCKDGVQTVFRINRLVAIVFIPNPFNLPEVDHLDGVKSNNHKSNLEWVTKNENMTRAHNRRRNRKRI